MNKRKILLIGCGKTGNKLVNDMMVKDSRYTGIFVNSSYGDMASLPKFNQDTNAFLFPGTNGSGKDPAIAEQFVKGSIKSLVDMVSGYPLHDTIVILSSADGGTGSGTTPMLAKLLKHTFMSKNLTNKKINVIGVAPDIKNNDKISFENTIRFWNNLMDLTKKSKFKVGDEIIEDTIVDDIKIVDNSKGNGYKDINEKVVTALNNSYSMNGVHDDGEIDDRDARVFSTGKGFGLILSLDTGFENASDAVDDAIKNCIFAIPNSYKCQNIGVSLNENDYLIEDVLNCFKDIKNTAFKTYNNKHNTVVLGGCTSLDEIINNINNRLEEMLSEKEDFVEVNDMKIGTKVKPKTVIKQETPVFTESDLDDIANELENLFG